MIGAIRQAAAFALLVGVALCASAPASGQTAEEVDWCRGLNGASPDLQIRSCTIMIDADKYPGKPIAPVYGLRALAYAAKGDFDRAIADYDQALRRDPELEPALVNRGSAWLAKGDAARSLTDFDAAARLAPNDPLAHVGRGRVHFASADFAASASAFKTAFALSAPPDDAYVAIWGRIAGSRAGLPGSNELEAAISGLDPDEWPRAVGALYLGAASPEMALQSAKDDETRCEAEFYVGEWYLIQGRRSEARGHLEKAESTCPPTFWEWDGAHAELMRLN